MWNLEFFHTLYLGRRRALRKRTLEVHERRV
jgi:hypothetical protein